MNHQLRVASVPLREPGSIEGELVAPRPAFLVLTACTVPTSRRAMALVARNATDARELQG
jgi:hypothetical protein